jgi:hypothetical protein
VVQIIKRLLGVLLAICDLHHLINGPITFPEFRSELILVGAVTEPCSDRFYYA